MIEHGSNPNNRASDGDALIDAYEIQAETDPNGPDSDDDGDSDHKEVYGGVDPNDPDSNCSNTGSRCGPDYTLPTTTLLLPPPPTAIAPASD